MYRPWLSLLAWLLVVGVVRAFWHIEMPRNWLTLDHVALEGLLKVALWVVPPVLFLMAVGRQNLRQTWRELGLGAPARAGYAFGLMATVPMALALPFTARLFRPDLASIIGTVLAGPFAEEVLFRGFLLAFLVRRAGWSVPAAIGVTSLAFGLAHMEWRPPALALMSAGGALFAWVYCRWGSLWYAIGLHASINLWWELTSGRAASAISSADTMPVSAAHGASIALAVLLTLRLKPTLSPKLSQEFVN